MDVLVDSGSFKNILIALVIDTRNPMLEEIDGKKKIKICNEIVKNLLKEADDKEGSESWHDEFHHGSSTYIEFCVFNMSGELMVDWTHVEPYRSYFDTLPVDKSEKIDFNATVNIVVEHLYKRRKHMCSLGNSQFVANMIMISDFYNLDNNAALNDRAIVYLTKNRFYQETIYLTFIQIGEEEQRNNLYKKTCYLDGILLKDNDFTAEKIKALLNKEPPLLYEEPWESSEYEPIEFITIPSQNSSDNEENLRRFKYE